ncbi:NitT/TauT family transport system ATP-binding protein OS=Castellaniella defragrans OX=75697 GN=HNR28_002968 PE=4 SV=1 [Castellaniella defragrans]
MRSHDDGTVSGPGPAEVPALEFDRITCAFRDRKVKGRTYSALGETSIAIMPGEFVSVVGPTGCGKSTLLNIASGLMSPSSGKVRVFGETLRGLNRRAGYMFQADTLMPWRSALDNVMLGLEYAGGRAEADRELAMSWLGQVGLKGFEHTHPYYLSGGMRKRVALAQMLILDPKIILMDEPFSALDIQTRQLMENELLELWSKDRKSVLFITHDLDEAISMSDRVVVLSAGPATHPIADFKITISRPRNVADIRGDPEFSRLHARIWEKLREEVLRGYSRPE